MARVHHVKAARKDYPDADIKKGESYYWWKFRYGGKRMQKTYPKQSQLTQSEFLGTIYDIQDRLEALGGDIEEAKSERDAIVSELQDLASECEDRKSNMPDGLQEGPTGEMLQNRSDECNSMADELDGVDLDIENEFDEKDYKREPNESEEDFKKRVEDAENEAETEYDQKVEDAIGELQGISYNGE